MTKEEKIQEAYGEHWEKLKDYVDENGWLIYSKSRPITLVSYFDVNEIEFDGFCSRLKSLQGIENNNGWVEFNKDSDIFLDWFTAWVYSEDMILYATWNPNQEYWLGTDLDLVKNVTHYQPINKPLKPLY